MKKLLFLLFFISPLYAFDYNNSFDILEFSTTIAKPDLNISSNTLNVNTTWYRISSATEAVSGGIADLFYSKFSPMNCDGTYLMLMRENNWNQCMLYNSVSHTFIKLFEPIDSDHKITVDDVPDCNFPIMEGQDPRWSKTEPTIIYCWGHVNGSYPMNLMRYDVEKCTATTVHDFSAEYPDGDTIENGAEGDFSEDGRYCAFMVKRIDSGIYRTIAVGVYDMVANEVIGSMDADDYVTLGGNYKNETYNTLPSPNMVDISPDGTRIMMLNMRCYSYIVDEEEQGIRPLDVGSKFDGGWCWDKEFTSASAVKVTIDATHTGWAYDENGVAMVISQQNRVDYIQAAYITVSNTFYIMPMKDTTYGSGYDNSVHFARMPLTPIATGWVLASFYGNNKTTHNRWADDNLVMIKVTPLVGDTPIVWRLGNDWNNHTAYRSEGIAAIAQDGTKLWWNAQRWGDDGNIECYQMELPSNWWVELAGEGGDPPPVATPRKFIIRK